MCKCASICKVLPKTSKHFSIYIPTSKYVEFEFNWISHQLTYLAKKFYQAQKTELDGCPSASSQSAKSTKSSKAEVHEWIFCKALNLYGPATVYDWIKMVNIPSEAVLESYFNVFQTFPCVVRLIMPFLGF